MKLKGRKVADWDSLEKPGDWCFVNSDKNQIAFLAFICPCGNCDKTYASMIPINKVKEDRGWEWDGNEENPTLKPSIQRRCDTKENKEYGIKGHKCNWHGYFTKGVWISC